MSSWRGTTETHGSTPSTTQAHPRLPAQLTPGSLLPIAAQRPLKEAAEPPASPLITGCQHGGDSAGTAVPRVATVRETRQRSALSADAAAARQLSLRRTLELTLLPWKRGRSGEYGKKTSSTVRKFCRNANSLGFYPVIHNRALRPQNICLTTSSAHAAQCFSPRCTGQAQPLQPASSPAFVSLQQLCDPKSQFHAPAGQW